MDAFRPYMPLSMHTRSWLYPSEPREPWHHMHAWTSLDNHSMSWVHSGYICHFTERAADMHTCKRITKGGAKELASPGVHANHPREERTTLPLQHMKFRMHESIQLIIPCHGCIPVMYATLHAYKELATSQWTQGYMPITPGRRGRPSPCNIWTYACMNQFI